MEKKFRIGVFTSAWDQTALDLVKAIYEMCGVESRINFAYAFCSRERGETKYGNDMLDLLAKLKIPYASFSSVKLLKKLKDQGMKPEQRREAHDQHLMKGIFVPKLDLIVLIGYMWILSPSACDEYKIINLHPDYPNRFKGTYIQVIWQLIKHQQEVAGAMMHLVTKDLDMGPPIACCYFPIKGDRLDPLWLEMEARLRTEPLEKIVEIEGETNPLFQAIRQEGVKREPLIVTETIKMLAYEKIVIEENKILRGRGGCPIKLFDLTEQIEARLAKK